MRAFDPELFLGLIEKHRVTRIYLVPPILLFLAQSPLVEKFDISSLDYVLSGAAPLGDEQVRLASERIDCLVCQGYGLTETSPVTHRIPDRLPVVKRGSIGRLIPSTQARIIDVASGRELAANEPGEILVRGPQVMLGYLGNPQATAETIDEDGWLHTGDIGYVDEEGYFFIVDRLKELIKCKGYQVAPAELEALLLTHPAIADAAVVASPDERAGEVPRAFVVRAAEIGGEEIMDWVAERVAPYKQIGLVELIDQIPRSPSGKILRRVLRDR